MENDGFWPIVARRNRSAYSSQWRQENRRGPSSMSRRRSWEQTRIRWRPRPRYLVCEAFPGAREGGSVSMLGLFPQKHDRFLACFWGGAPAPGHSESKVLVMSPAIGAPILREAVSLLRCANRRAERAQCVACAVSETCACMTTARVSRPEDLTASSPQAGISGRSRRWEAEESEGVSPQACRFCVVSTRFGCTEAAVVCRTRTGSHHV